MKIEQSSVNLQASHAASSSQEADFTYNDDFRRVLAESSTAQIAAAARTDDPPQQVLVLLHTLITLLLRIISGAVDASPTAPLDPSAAQDTESPQAPAPRSVHWTSTWHERSTESERSTFNARGEVRTADGQRLAFDLKLSLTRSFTYEATTTESGSFVLRDPLLVDLGGHGAALSGRRFAFDLDADGIAEAIPALAGGTAFLALDRNGDGRIGDGRELFGSRSGDGFADLAALDDDGNGWIDAADRAFAELRLWTPGDAQGQLHTLQEEGIGALGLQHVDTPFALRDAENRPLGQLRQSGVYLREDGRAGALQQVDVAV